MAEHTRRTREVESYKPHILDEVDTQVFPMFESIAHKLADMPSERYLIKAAIWELVGEGRLTMTKHMILVRKGGHDGRQEG